MPRPDYLILGRIAKGHGVRGEVKVVLYADGWEPFRGLDRCLVGPSNGSFQSMRIQAVAERGRTVTLKLAGVETPEAAAALAGHDVGIRRAEAPPPPEGTFYHYDILGLEVVAGGRMLGAVREILETPAHDVYVVEGPAGEWFVPATRAHIHRIDLAVGRIELDPAADVDGLLTRRSQEGARSDAV
jgi:16S rRNA processing protein RimM